MQLFDTFGYCTIPIVAFFTLLLVGFMEIGQEMYVFSSSPSRALDVFMVRLPAKTLSTTTIMTWVSISFEIFLVIFDVIEPQIWMSSVSSSNAISSRSPLWVHLLRMESLLTLFLLFSSKYNLNLQLVSTRQRKCAERRFTLIQNQFSNNHHRNFPLAPIDWRTAQTLLEEATNTNTDNDQEKHSKPLHRTLLHCWREINSMARKRV
jgi:hypothetical protein